MAQVKEDATAARSNAQDAFNLAWYARNKSDELSTDLSGITDKILNFLTEDQPTPAMVRDQAERALAKNIQLNPDEIRDLAQNISSIVGSLTNSERIIADAAGDLRLANELRTRANNTKNEAISKQNQAIVITDLLEASREAQGRAEAAINTARIDIDQSQTHLNSIIQDMLFAKDIADNITAKVQSLDGRLKHLQTQLAKNDYTLKEEIAKQAEDVIKEAETVQNKTMKLGQEYRLAEDSLGERVNKSKGDIQKAKLLLQRASELTADTSTKFKDLDGMETVYRDNERKLADLMAIVDALTADMEIHWNEIEEKSLVYRRCLT